MVNPRPLRIDKDRRKAVIFTPRFRVVGTVHMPPGGRISDFLNYNVNQNPFIPVTEASVYSLDRNELLFTAEFISINRNCIHLFSLHRESGESEVT